MRKTERRGILRAVAVALSLIASSGPLLAVASTEWVGRATFKDASVPGAQVTAVRGDVRRVTTTDEDGVWRLPLDDGTWTVRIEMRGFLPVEFDVDALAPPVFTTSTLELALPGTTDLSSPARLATREINAPRERAADEDAPVEATDRPSTAEGLVVEGSVYNAAASPFAQAPAFGNFRPSRRSVYSLSTGLTGGHSAWDARPFSFAAQPPAAPDYADVQVTVSFGGPVKIPFTRATRPMVTASYQRAATTAAESISTRVPTMAERAGDFSATVDGRGRPVVVTDPASGLAFPGAVVPLDRQSSQALALLALYPAPNVVASGPTNFEAVVTDRSTRDSVDVRVAAALPARQQITAGVSYQRAISASTSLFQFVDESRRREVTASVAWSYRFSPTRMLTARYDVTGSSNETTPFFAERVDVSGDAGIVGNDRTPRSWGPPNLHFSSGVAGLTTAAPASQRSRTHVLAVDGRWMRGYHNLSMGVELRPRRVDVASRVDPRGTFTFTGAATGYDVADFLLGLPQARSVSFGDDRTLSGSSASAFVTDDWRLAPGFTVNAGVRWEFESPFRERHGRLSNLDLASDFGAAAQVTPADVAGPITGRTIPQTLIAPDYRGVQPRIGVAWRPLAASTLLVRAGYGLYRRTDVYLPMALWLARQPPFATTANVETSDVRPLSLANGLAQATSDARNTMAVDAALRVGYAENWNIAVQRDLPGSLAMAVTYLGTRGHRLLQQLLPNTVAPGAENPCATCPAGFIYVASNGSSLRNALQLQIRRRMRSGLAANLLYTFARAEDDATAFGGISASGTSIAQDWRDLDAEWGPSSFDQRHVVTAEAEYTSGVGVAGGALLTGWRGRLLKGWVFAARLTAGSGLPLTPRSLAPVPGTAVTGVIRASLTGDTSPLPAGVYLSPGAYRAPAAGEWGNAGRNSARGPGQMLLNASVARSFTMGERTSLEWRIDATNVLNRVSYVSVNTLVGSAQFGLPDRAAPMRTVRTSLRWRF